MVSIRNAIQDAIDDIGLDHDKDIPLFTNWAIKCEKGIRSYYQFTKKRAVLDIEGCSACLPDDAVFLQRAILGDHGCDCEDLFNTWCNTYQTNGLAGLGSDQNSFLIVDIGTTTSYGYSYVAHEVQDNKIIFEKNLNGQKVTIQYLGYQYDCDGFLMVNENHLNAITNYICYKYFLRKKRKSNDDFNSVNHYNREWHRYVADARAKDSELTETDREAIVAMHHDPYIGIGLSVGMRTTLDGTYNW